MIDLILSASFFLLALFVSWGVQRQYRKNLILKDRIMQRYVEAKRMSGQMECARTCARQLLDEAVYERKLAQHLSDINKKNNHEE